MAQQGDPVAPPGACGAALGVLETQELNETVFARTSIYFWTSRKLSPPPNAGPLGHPAERHSEYAIFGSYKLWLEYLSLRGLLGRVLVVSWEPMEYVQNASQHLAKIVNNG